MKVKVRLFASLREEVGQEEVELEASDNCTVSELLEAFASRFPKAASYGPILVAVNKEIARPKQAVDEDDEVAFLPPVSGGNDRDRIVREDFNLESLLEELTHPEEGAIVLFLGSVRGSSGQKRVRALRYEVYEEMADEMIRRIEEEVRQDSGVRRVLVQHRVGDLTPGERTILVAAVARHRGEAFDACRKALERVKAKAPIWKKEVYDDGEAWVRPHSGDHSEQGG